MRFINIENYSDCETLELCDSLVCAYSEAKIELATLMKQGRDINNLGISIAKTTNKHYNEKLYYRIEVNAYGDNWWILSEDAQEIYGMLHDFDKFKNHLKYLGLEKTAEKYREECSSYAG